MATDKLRFGTFEVDLQLRELRRNGLRLKLQEQPFQILAALLEHPSEIVSREELRRRLWPEDTFVDFDNSLNAAVNRLREALDDSADNPRFIETLPRRGYRFISAVQELAEPGEPEMPARPAKIAPSRRSWIAVFAASAVVLAVLVYFALRDRIGGSSDGHAPVIHALAVLPLENLSGDPEQDYFVEGVTDELITNLAKIRTLRVISRTSTARFKGTKKSLPDIARELDVDAVIEGSVTRSAERVHITAQLILTRPERHLWAESYDRPVGDVVQLQDELAHEIAGAIRIKLLPEDEARMARRRQIDPDTYQLYLKGRYFWNKRTGPDLRKAADYFQQAIARRPDYAEAYAGLADCEVLIGGYSIESPAVAMPKARAAAEKALELDNSLAEAHASMGLIAPFFGWNWEESKKQFELAIALKPNYATAHHWYGDGYWMPMGRMDEAIAEIRQAEKLDPLSLIIVTDIGKDLYLARRYEEAIVQLQKALDIDPNFAAAHGWLYAVYLAQGKYPEARAELETIKPPPSRPEYMLAQARIAWKAGQKKKARAYLAQVLTIARKEYVSPGSIGSLYAEMGDRDQAFAWLEKALAEKSAYMTSLKVFQYYDPIRDDPRFADLVHRAGLSQ